MWATVRVSLSSSLVLLFAASTAHAQRMVCPEPDHTMQSLKAELLWLAQSNEVGVENLVFRALTPGPPPACAALPSSWQPNAVLEELIDFAGTNGDPALNHRLMTGIRVVLTMDSLRTLRFPMRALANTVERGATPQARGAAFYTIERFAYVDEARDYLLRWARSRCGPLLWPELPRVIVHGLRISMAPEIAAEIRRDLAGRPELINNPRVRQLVIGNESGEGPPRHIIPDPCPSSRSG